MQAVTKENINNHFFDGIYKEIWKQVIPDGLTRSENEWLLQELNLKPGERLIDLMCGYGRHALALAKTGIGVTAIDNLHSYIEEIRTQAERDNLPVNVIEQDVVNMELDGIDQAAICMGNSICFFPADDVVKIFLNLSKHLQVGSKLIICSWRLTETVANNFKEKLWSYVGEIKFLSDSRFLCSPARIESQNFFIRPNGETEQKTAIDYIYSLNETEQMLNLAGFLMKEVWSIPGKKKFMLGDPRAYIVAERK